ncbi:Pentatricopeptide repeat-containing protein [Hibiscus syriacus]|uniref:Pentatricopeptide repeat-containing protein n=1 Tax=Hibiscus syriacus TaxID=106335 RepID=A0A6A2Y932_HIBSY|nr:pentatricopeptide repeat-containing protein At2g17525, mitochondrial [Hibiscus syriacus]KAE8678645.1 Pentatricopeptide repeat-containing protein [Hibiscus syriacus]
MTKLPHRLPLSCILSAFSSIQTHFHLNSLPRFHSRIVSSSSSSSSTGLVVPSHDHISRLILDQSSPEAALQTFHWASKLSNFTHSQSTYRALIHKLCAFRRFNDVNQLLDEMPSSIGVPPDEDTLVTLVRGLGRARMIRDVIKVVDLASRFNTQLSLKIFNSILDVLVKEDIDLARNFYRKKMISTGVHGDDYTFGILMKGLCVTNRIAEAFKLLQLIKSSTVKPNAVVYNTLIHALCKNGKVGRARSLMNELDDPNVVTFNILISAYCKEENLVQALVLLEKSFAMGFTPDVITLTKILKIICDAGRVVEAFEILEKVESKRGVIDVVAYNTLIRGYCRIGKVRLGQRLYMEMERKGCLPNADTCNILISGFCESNMLDSALDMFNEMKADGISWNFVTYDTLIKGLCSAGRMEDGFKILELMEESKAGSGGRVSPYNSVLYGLYKKNRLEEASEFLSKMQNLFPRAVDRSLRILEFCKEGRVEDAKRVYNEITGQEGMPSVLVYDCLIRSLCLEGCTREAVELMNEMVGYGYLPTASTFNDVIRRFCSNGKLANALKLMEDMVGRGCTLDGGSYSLLIKGFCRMGDIQKAIMLLLQMLGENVIPDEMTWNSVLVCLSREREWSESKKMLHVNNLLECIIET